MAEDNGMQVDKEYIRDLVKGYLEDNLELEVDEFTDGDTFTTHTVHKVMLHLDGETISEVNIETDKD